jgi:hypothetical protein
MKKIYMFLSLGMFTMGLTSCLKDKNVEDQKYGMINVNAFKVTALPVASNSFSLVQENKATSLGFVTVALQAEDVAQEDVKVTLSIDQTDAQVTAYNAVTANTVKIARFPTNKYTLPDGLVVTIPKGSRSGALKLNFNAQDLDLTTPYALAFRIVGAPEGYTISGNNNNTLVRISAKNRFDGAYTSTGTMRDVVSAALTGAYPLDVTLRTSGANSVTYYNSSGTESHLIKNGSASSSYGGFTPVFTIDANNNVTSVTNSPTYQGNTATNPNNRTARLDPTGINKFTPASGTNPAKLEVSYIMVQGTDRTFFTEVFTRTGDRP